MGPAIIVFPDCFTSLGGNQYVNSSAIGNYADFLLDEVIPLVDKEFRTLASRDHRGADRGELSTDPEALSLASATSAALDPSPGSSSPQQGAVSHARKAVDKSPRK